MNLTHGNAALLAPYVDEDADGFVTPDEMTAFLNRFGGVKPPNQGYLEAAVEKVGCFPCVSFERPAQIAQFIYFL
jgi:hypothetical protein